MTDTLTKQKTRLYCRVEKQLADQVTPVSLYLRLRDHYTEPVLLESNDQHSTEDLSSFLGLDPVATFIVQAGQMRIQWPDGSTTESAVTDTSQVPQALRDFSSHFSPQYPAGEAVRFNGLFGHTSFDGVQYFDTLQFDAEKRRFDLPDIRYTLYRFVVAIDHYRDQMTVVENLLEGQSSELDALLRRIHAPLEATFDFSLQGDERSNLTDEQFMELVNRGKEHCQRGDVFQIVFSRQFEQDFQGDDFQVYRILRSVNPSPYLFYFDYGSYRIFGSSPEAQMVIRNQVARVNPIAGTYRRTGDDTEDAQQARLLAADPKENAEHIMLVDLARNDLGRHATNIRVSALKEIQFFSHVIHLVSTVEGDMLPGENPVQIFGDTFPAGTLSGAPKYRALQLINQYENQNRAYYGGALGYIGFDGEMNQAIVIRSFMSRDNTLYYQAGAGVVKASVAASECQEVNNKLGALKRALELAEKLS